MSVNLEALLGDHVDRDLQLVAGAGGLDREAAWVCHVETPREAQRMQGGELAVITGMGLPEGRQNAELASHIMRLKDAGASGAVVVTGTYLTEISQAVRDYCDNNAFPLFRADADVDQEHLLREFCEAIVRDNARDLEISTAFKNAILFPDQPERYVVPLSQHHFEAEDRYAICVLKMEQVAAEPYAAAEAIRERLWNHLKREYPKCAVFTNGADIIAVISTEHSREVRVLAEDLLDYTRYLLPSDQHTIYIGIGKLTKSIRCIYKSYRQAESIVKLQMKNSVPMTTIFYTDMGVYRLLMGIEDEDIKQEYFEKVLGPLLEHDREKDSDLTKVLQMYLRNNGSIAATAKELYVHRNTVTYKINQASKILNMDLGLLENRVQIWLAFLLHEMA